MPSAGKRRPLPKAAGTDRRTDAPGLTWESCSNATAVSTRSGGRPPLKAPSGLASAADPHTESLFSALPAWEDRTGTHISAPHPRRVGGTLPLGWTLALALAQSW